MNGEKTSSQGTPASNPARAAALLARLGRDASTEVLKRLTAAQVALLGRAFREIGQMPAAARRELAEEAWREAAAAAHPDLLKYARDLLNARLGAEEAEKLLSERERPAAASTSLEWIPDSAAETLAAAFQEESPRIAAPMLASLRPALAARVLSLLPEGTQGKVVLALAAATTPTAEAVSAIGEAVAEMIRPSATSGAKTHLLDRRPRLATGIGKVAEIVRQCDRRTEHNVLEYLQEHAPEIANGVSQATFSRIEDLRWLDERSLQLVMRQVDPKDLALALRGASEELRELCLRNLSENAAASMREELEALGPQPRRRVEAAQQSVLQLVRAMLDEDRIRIADEEDLI